jgi:site-specific DNA-methyltransferase (adenine-specific)
VTNKLYYGDNLEVLRTFPDECVDLIYLDPPFNSNASYSILFKSPEGQGADAQIEAFNDTWTWGPAANDALMDITQSGNHKLHTLMQAMKTAIGENAMMAYLAMMAVRLVEMHRVLKATGSLYLHCDPTASHYLKLVLDAVFGPENFLGEIIWRRTAGKVGSRRWPRHHDVIFNFAKHHELAIFHAPRVAADEGWVAREYRHEDERGRYSLDNLTGAGRTNGPSGQPWRGVDPGKIGAGRHWRYVPETLDKLDAEGRIYWPKRGEYPKLKQYLHESEGTALGDLWTDIQVIGRTAAERLGYPTQKPVALLERIISASSNPGDVVLDPFCGCGTAIDAAQKLGRQWIGIDVTHLAIGLVEKRLREAYGDAAQWETIGVPRDLASAQRLAEEKPHDFQNWICLQLGGWPWMGGKKGGDKGVDGYFYYVGEGGQTETGVISVKAGHNVNPNMVRDLGRVMQRDGHKLGLFVSAALPTKGMEAEANSHEPVETEFGRFPALQIFTLAELFQDRRPKLPPLVSPNRKAPRVETRASHQKGSQGELL